MWILFIMVLVAIVLWLVASIRIVDKDEIAVVTYFGKPERVVESGPCFVPLLPYCELHRYATNVQEYEYPDVNLLTARTTGKNGHSAVRMQGSVSIRFKYSARLLATHTIKALPTNKNLVSTLLQEAVYDIVEDVGHNYDWEQLYHNTKGFNARVEQIVSNLPVDDPDNIIVQAGLENVKIMFTNPQLPPELEKAINLPEQASLESHAEAIRIRKREEAQALARERHAQAELVEETKRAEARERHALAARRENLMILGKLPDDKDAKFTAEEGMVLERIRTMKELAQGDNNFVISVPELSNFFGMSADGIKEILKKLGATTPTP